MYNAFWIQKMDHKIQSIHHLEIALQADACIRWTRQLCATSGCNAWRVAAKVLHETLGPSSVEELFKPLGVGSLKPSYDSYNQL